MSAAEAGTYLQLVSLCIADTVLFSACVSIADHSPCPVCEEQRAKEVRRTGQQADPAGPSHNPGQLKVSIIQTYILPGTERKISLLKVVTALFLKSSSADVSPWIIPHPVWVKCMILSGDWFHMATFHQMLLPLKDPFPSWGRGPDGRRWFMEIALPEKIKMW